MKGKTIIVGVTGGIAAYKAAELVRALTAEEAVPRVAMTANAARFVTPLTFETLSGHRVVSDMWEMQEKGSVDHITWGQEADFIVIAPATADFIAKMAHGMGDDFLSTMVLAATARILVCPSMNTQMFENPAVRENLDKLRERGVEVMDPDEGELACGAHGPGRLPDPPIIIETIRGFLSGNDLSGLKILISAGPTVEPIDPVRYISNRSSGKMGYALAGAARRRGASVILVSGPSALRPPAGVLFHSVKTAEEMMRAIMDNRSGCDIIIKAAAVSDYRPKETSGHKIKKGAESASLELVRNPDILALLGRKKQESPCVLVGFAAETRDLMKNAGEKLRDKNLDMIVVNDVSRTDAGFETDTNAVRIIHADGHVEETPLMTKESVADLVLDRAQAAVDANRYPDREEPK